MPGQDGVRALLAPVVAEAGLDLEDVSVSAAGKRRRVCVVVDGDGGVDLDAIARVSHDVSQALDASDALGDAPYVLEVTSPGVDRPLTLPRHWRRAVGRLVTCALEDGTTLSGRVTAADDVEAVLDVDGTAVAVPFSDVRRAQVDIEWSRPDAVAE